MKFLGSKKGDIDNSVWLSNSDLMAGLMIIFLFIAIGFIKEKAPEIVGQQDYILSYLSAKEAKENEINDLLNNSFSKDEKKSWQFEIIPEENLIRFNSPDVMFRQNKNELSDKFKDIINNFFPRYINVLSKFGSIIDEIRIEGHTSSEWSDITKEEAYIRNMVLSQERTMSVMNQALKSLTQKNIHVKAKEWAFSKVSASGLSSRSIIKDNYGNEDFVKSRRVEFRYVLNNDEKLNYISNYLKDFKNGKN